MKKPREEKYHFIPVVNGAQIHLVAVLPDEDRCYVPKKINANTICGLHVNATVEYESTEPIAAATVSALDSERGTYCCTCLGKLLQIMKINENKNAFPNSAYKIRSKKRKYSLR